MQKHYKFQIFSSFLLKIVAILTMTIDHVGVILGSILDLNPFNATLIYILRVIGRLALPLFCFMIVEGVLHTKNFKRYALSLGISAGAVFIGHVVLVHGLNGSMGQGNIFFDLLLGALAVKCLKDERSWVKALAILPIGYSLFSQFTYMYICPFYYPEYLQTQYGFIGVALILGFYGAHELTKLYYNIIAKRIGLNSDDFKSTPQYTLLENLMKTFVLVIIVVIFYVLANYFGIDFRIDVSLQTWSIISGALLLLYNGKRGYNSKWFQYGCYIYYPVHLLVLYGIQMLIIYL